MIRTARRCALALCLATGLGLFSTAEAKVLEVFAPEVEHDFEKGQTLFSKGVKLSGNGYKGQSDRAQIHLDQKTQKPLRLILEGNVIFWRGTTVFKANKITYNLKNGKLKIQGQVYSRFETDQILNKKP